MKGYQRPLTELRDEAGNLPAFAWPGGYDVMYLTKGCTVLCAKCANAEEQAAMESGEAPDDPIEAAQAMCDSDSCVYCENCNAQLAAYCTAEEHSEHCENRPTNDGVQS